LNVLQVDISLLALAASYRIFVCVTVLIILVVLLIFIV